MLSRCIIKAVFRALDVDSGNFLSQVSRLSISRSFQGFFILFLRFFALLLSLLRAFLNLWLSVPFFCLLLLILQSLAM